jgi:hypothetical protein
MDDEAVAALARSLLRQQIQDSGFYPQLKGKFRLEQIEQDVERYWHLMIPEARQRLLDQGVNTKACKGL